MNKGLAYWQEALRIQDWDVHYDIVPVHVLDDAFADITFIATKRAAYLRMVNPEHRSHDWEVSLVHELLHIHFAPFKTKAGSVQELAEEQAIHSISTALVVLRREGSDD